MKKLLLFAALLLFPTAASAQCNGSVPGGYVCGTAPGVAGVMGPILGSTPSPAGSVTLRVDHSAGVDQPSCGFVATGPFACKTDTYAFQSLQTNVKPGPGGEATIQNDCGFTEAATFVGPSATGGQGGGVVFVIGIQGAPATCSWTSSGNVVDDGAAVSIRGFTAITAGSNQTWLSVPKGGTAVATNMVWGQAINGIMIATQETGVFVFEGGGTQQLGMAACAPGCFNYLLAANAGNVELQSITFSIPTALSWNDFVSFNAAYANWSNVTFTGAGVAGTTGGQYSAQNGTHFSLTTTTIPGSATFNSINTGSCVNGACVPGPVANYSGLPTCNAQTVGALATVNDANGTFWGFQVTSGGGANQVNITCTPTGWNVSGSAAATGSAAYVNTGTSGATVPLLNAANAWSALQTFGTGDIAINITGALKGNGASAVTQAVCGDLSNAGTACSTNVNVGLAVSGSNLNSNAELIDTFAPGPLTSVTNTKGAFTAWNKASTVDNLVASATQFTCTVTPVVSLYECGTSPTCAAPTLIGGVGINAAGTAVSALTMSSASIAAGDYTAWEISGGTCASLDIVGKAQIHSN